MNKYEKPKFKIITFASPDVITTSFLEPEKDGYTNNNDEYNAEDILNNLFFM